MLKSSTASPYLTIPQLARILGISRIAVYKKVKKGIIPGVKIGRNFVVSSSYIHPKLSSKNYSSTTQIAQDLKVHRSTIYRRARKGLIAGVKVGRGFVHARGYVVEVESRELRKDEFVSIPELAKKMGVSRIAIYKKVKKGAIAAVKADKGYVIKKRDAMKLVSRAKVKTGRMARRSKT